MDNGNYLVNRFPAGTGRAQACLDAINLVGRSLWQSAGYPLKQDDEGVDYIEGKRGDGTTDPNARLYSFAEIEIVTVDGIAYEQFYSPTNLEMFIDWKQWLTDDLGFTDFGEEVVYEPQEIGE